MFEYYVIYLRKSRADDPSQPVEEVLAKHESILQEYAVKEFGGRIPEDNIYREVVSGESIEERVEIQRLLARVEDPKIKGVLVVDPQRLSRGDLEDCGRLINDLRYTRTQVVTPAMTYDLENKMERKFFQDELLRGRDYLEYVKETLLRGRVAAVKRGCFIGQCAPYGYRKVVIGKDYTLEPVEEEADVVRLVFDWYVHEGLTPGRIARRLIEMGAKTQKGSRWSRETIRAMVRNRHYAGMVSFFAVRETTVIENGERIVRHIAQPESEILIAEGKHPAIIDRATWDAAQELVARNPKVKHTHTLKNPFSSLLYCSECGRSLYLQFYRRPGNEDRFYCRSVVPCSKSVPYSVMYKAVLVALEEAELPALKLKIKNGDGDALKIQQRLVAKLEAQMDELLAQEETQFDLLENKTYTPEVFERRHSALLSKMETCRSELYAAKASMPKSVDYAERVVALESAVDILKKPDATAAEKNRILKAVVDRIIFHGAPKDVKRGENPFTLEVFLKL